MEQRNWAVRVLVGFTASLAVWIVAGGAFQESDLGTASRLARRQPAGYPQLISVDPLPTPESAMCE